MRTINAKCGAIIPIGRLGENEATAVVFDVTEWITLFGAGTFSLLHQRRGDPGPYLCNIEHDETTVTWTVTSADLGVRGYGKCELVYTVNDTVAKSVIYTTFVGDALTGGIEPPEPWEDWIERVLEAGVAAVEAAESAGTSAESAGASAETATEKASDAAQSASVAESAQSAAETAQSVAAASATTASEHATAAENSATAANNAKEAADTAKTAAQNAATTATQQATAAATSASNAAASAQSASESATGAVTSATAAENAKDTAIAALEAFRAPTATAQTLQPGTPATASYDGQNFTFGIPQGIQGIRGPKGDDGLTISVTVNGETFTQSGGNVNLGTLLRQHQSLATYRTASEQDVIDAGISGRVESVENVVPAAASSTNKLVSASEMGDAIEAVEAKQLYATAQQGSFATKSALTSATVFYNADGTVATPTKNDVAYILADESHSGKSAKYVIASVDPIVWGFVITFSDTTFSQAQMDAINSGITNEKRAGYDSHVADGDIHVTSEQKQTWSGKQDAISDLATIRSGAAAGATAVQPETGKGLFSGNYNDLSNKPTIPTQLSQLSGDTTHRTVTDAEKTTWNGKGTYSKPSGGIPKTDLTSAVQSSLDKADSALQEHQSLASYRTSADQDVIDAGKLDKSGGTMTGTLDFGTLNYMAKTFGRNFLVCSGASGFLQVGATELRFKFQGSTQRPQYYSAVDAQNHDIALYEDVPQIQYSATDIGEGAQLATGTFYFVYE